MEEEGARLRFVTSAGRVISMSERPPLDADVGAAHLRERHRGREITELTPVALDRGAPFDLGYVTSVLCDGAAYRRTQARPRGSPMVPG